MAVVHFTTIPCEPNTANEAHTESHIFFEKFVPVLTTLCMRFEDFRTFLCVFMSIFSFFCALRVMSKSFSVWRWIADYRSYFGDIQVQLCQVGVWCVRLDQQRPALSESGYGKTSARNGGFSQAVQRSSGTAGLFVGLLDMSTVPPEVCVANLASPYSSRCLAFRCRCLNSTYPDPTSLTFNVFNFNYYFF